MKYPKFKWLVTALLVGITLGSFASRKDEVTLVMVPWDEGSVKVGLDLAEKYPTLLVSYTMAPKGAVSLRGWTGSQWVGISAEDFQAGNFFRTGPASAVVVEAAGVAVPAGLLPVRSWCPAAYRITTTEPRPLLHLAGRYFDFSYKEWQWFSKRYNLELEAINPDGLNVAWYHKRLDDHLKHRGNIFSDDLQYWVVIHESVAVEPAAPVELDAAEDEPLEGNPLTNAAPEAVVMTAADAVAEDGVVEEATADAPDSME